jgi:hypothetical protein
MTFRNFFFSWFLAGNNFLIVAVSIVSVVLLTVGFIGSRVEDRRAKRERQGSV